MLSNTRQALINLIIANTLTAISLVGLLFNCVFCVPKKICKQSMALVQHIYKKLQKYLLQNFSFKNKSTLIDIRHNQKVQTVKEDIPLQQQIKRTMENMVKIQHSLYKISTERRQAEQRLYETNRRLAKTDSHVLECKKTNFRNLETIQLLRQKIKTINRQIETLSTEKINPVIANIEQQLSCQKPAVDANLTIKNLQDHTEPLEDSLKSL